MRATANAALFLGAVPRFSDIDSSTGNIDPESVERLINEKTKAIVAVDFAGQPCALDELRELTSKYNLFLIEDAAHALGATYKGKHVGSISDLSVFSFHPVKSITTGEGGAVTTNDAHLAQKMRIFRNHGITKDAASMHQHEPDPWYYEMQEIGFNYRLTDIQAALGISQLRRLPQFIERRRAIARQYRQSLEQVPGIHLLSESSDSESAHHLFPILIDEPQAEQTRARLVRALHAENIGVQVHYIPVYKHPVYRALFQESPPANLRSTENFYRAVLSLPLFPAMADNDVLDVIEALKKVLPYCLAENAGGNGR